MKILAIDTSGRSVSAAAAEDGTLLAYNWFARGNMSDEALMPCVDALLSGLGVKPDAFDAYAAVVGPGSFTGLRIGLAVVKAFAFARGAGTVAVPTLDALARNLAGYSGALLCPVIDARNQSVYSAVYAAAADAHTARSFAHATAVASAVHSATVDNGRTPRMVGEARVMRLDELPERIYGLAASTPGVTRVVFNGDAADICRDRFSIFAPETPCAVADERDLMQNAAAAALFACERATRGELVPPELLTPDYMNAGYMANKPALDAGRG